MTQSSQTVQYRAIASSSANVLADDLPHIVLKQSTKLSDGVQLMQSRIFCRLSQFWSNFNFPRPTWNKIHLETFPQCMHSNNKVPLFKSAILNSIAVLASFIPLFCLFTRLGLLSFYTCLVIFVVYHQLYEH